MPQTPPEKANRLLERVVQLYAKTFDDVSEGRTYFERRGIADVGLLGRHRVGYADGRLKDLLPKNGQLKDELRDLGILLEDPSTGSGQVARERFDGCVVFPMCDPEGTLTTICGKSVGDDSASYVCLPAHPTGLWNAVALKTYPELLLATSIIDALSVMMAGQANVIGIQGAGGVADHDAAMLKAYGVQRVTLLLASRRSGIYCGRSLTMNKVATLAVVLCAIIGAS